MAVPRSSLTVRWDIDGNRGPVKSCGNLCEEALPGALNNAVLDCRADLRIPLAAYTAAGTVKGMVLMPGPPMVPQLRAAFFLRCQPLPHVLRYRAFLTTEGQT